jgi:hypothetical protein
MYLVTTEAQDGTWVDVPEGFPTQDEAISYISLFRRALLPGNALVLYQCVTLQAYEHTPQVTEQPHE